MKDFELRVLSVLVWDKIIPEKGIFQITEHMLKQYTKVYGEIFTKGKGLKSRNEYRFARKLAGRTLIKENINRGAKFNDISAGMVYIISNPAFKDHVKIGMTLDVIDRLAQYQTYDPFRQFKIEKYNFVLDRLKMESLILYHPNIIKESGEWIKKENAIEIFAQLTHY